MSEPIQDKNYEHSFVFFGRKIIRNGDHYVVNIPVKTALYIMSTYGGYVDIEVNVPTKFPKKQKEAKRA